MKRAFAVNLLFLVHCFHQKQTEGKRSAVFLFRKTWTGLMSVWLWGALLHSVFLHV